MQIYKANNKAMQFLRQYLEKLPLKQLAIIFPGSASVKPLHLRSLSKSCKLFIFFCFLPSFCCKILIFLFNSSSFLLLLNDVCTSLSTVTVGTTLNIPSVLSTFGLSSTASSKVK